MMIIIIITTTNYKTSASSVSSSIWRRYYDRHLQHPSQLAGQKDLPMIFHEEFATPRPIYYHHLNKQSFLWNNASLLPSNDKFRAQLLKDIKLFMLMLSSFGKLLGASKIHCKIIFFGGAFVCPDLLYWWIPELIHFSYSSETCVWNRLFQETSAEWMWAVYNLAKLL